MVHGSVHGFVHGFVHGLTTVDYPVFFPPMSTLTLDTIVTLSGTWGFYLNNVIPLGPFKSVLDHVVHEHGGLPFIPPCSVHPDMGHPPDTHRYLELLSKPFNTTQPFKFVFDNVPLEHGGLPFIPPYAVHLDLQHLPDTQGYLGLLSEQCRPTHSF